MIKIMLRVLLIGGLILGLGGLHRPASVQAEGTGTWASTPPVLDGVAGASEWGSAQHLTFTHFNVRYQNDNQFLYLLIDVIGEHPASPDSISQNENFSIYVDADKNGAPTANVDRSYFLGYPPPYGLLESVSLGGNVWTTGSEAISYAVAGFGPSPDLATPHRIYEVAIRLSEIPTLPGYSVLAAFLVSSTNPSFLESDPVNAYTMANFIELGLASPQVAYIYNTPDGYTDAQAFQTSLYNTSGILVEPVIMGQAANIDFSPYRTIIVGDDTANNSGVTLMSAAAVQKIGKSGKPVVGIGYGGEGIFNALGLYLTHSNSWQWLAGSTGVQPSAPRNPAWNVPHPISTAGAVALYSSAVVFDAVYTGDSSFPSQSITLLGAQTGNAVHYPILGQLSNGTCYTLWGFYSHPSLLTVDGQRLFANLVWQPVCMPATVYLSGSDATLTSQIDTLLANAGFPYQSTPAATVSSFDLRPFQRIIVGWDTETAWDTPANVNVMKNNRLPMLEMGDGGFYLYFRKLLQPNGTFIHIVNLETELTLVDPLQPAMLSPNPVEVDSSLQATLDSGSGGQVYIQWSDSLPGGSSRLIGYVYPFTTGFGIFTQSYKGSCYSFWGLEGYPASMTTLSSNLFMNMVVSPTCNYSVNLPLILR